MKEVPVKTLFMMEGWINGKVEGEIVKEAERGWKGGKNIDLNVSHPSFHHSIIPQFHYSFLQFLS
jgi:hypothetical protein